jgi:DNA-binding CsgD family transcriptional regulator
MTTARSSKRDVAALEQLQNELRTLRVGAPSFVRQFVRDLRDLLGSAATVVCGMQRSLGELNEPSFAHSDGLEEDAFLRGLPDLVAREPVRWGRFDVARPQAAQRNTVMAWTPAELAELAELTATEGSPVALREPYPSVGVTGLAQMRVLVCEGPSLLAYVGAFQAAAYDERQRALLAALVPDLQRRLAVERQLAEGMRKPVLDIVLEAIACAALVVDPTGRVLDANAIARAMLDEPGSTLRSELPDVVIVPAEHPEWSVSPVEARGCSGQRLVVATRRPLREPLSVRIAVAATRWNLSPRQRGVLAKVAEGNANRTIAAMLGISERTVEVHVTALLEKAQVENRSEMIAKLWTMDA